MTLIGKAEACRARGNGAERGNTRLMGPKGLEGGVGGQVLECESSGSGQTPRRTGKEGRPAGPGSPPPPRTLALTVRQGTAADSEWGSRLALVCPGLPKPRSPLLRVGTEPGRREGQWGWQTHFTAAAIIRDGEETAPRR